MAEPKAMAKEGELEKQDLTAVADTKKRMFLAGNKPVKGSCCQKQPCEESRVTGDAAVAAAFVLPAGGISCAR